VAIDKVSIQNKVTCRVSAVAGSQSESKARSRCTASRRICRQGHAGKGACWQFELLNRLGAVSAKEEW
jgi:hypothetical protein